MEFRAGAGNLRRDVTAEKSTAVQIAKEPTTPKLVTLENAFDRANAIFEAISRRAYEIFQQRGGNSTLDLEAVLTTVVAKAVQLSGTDAGAIFLFDNVTGRFRFGYT